MERCDREVEFKPSGARKVVFGLIVIALGALLLADNFVGLSHYLRNIVFSIPMGIIAIGFLNLFGRRSYVTGVIIIIIGTFFLIPRIFIGITPDFNRLFWPSILIAVGLLIIVRRGIGHNHLHHHVHHHFQEAAPVDTADSYIDEVNIFGGGKKRITTQTFKGGKITSIFGGSELDFTNAQLAEGTNIIDIVCIFGGTSMILPPDWNVRVEVVSVLGGFADKRLNITTATSKDKILIIKGMAIFGGGEIRSV